MIIIGYSGHAYVAIDIAIDLSYNIIGYVDRVEKEINPYKLQYLGADEILNNKPYDKAQLFIAIGDNHIRSKIYTSLKDNYSFATIVHPRSIQSSQIIIGEGTIIAAGAIINPMAELGKACIINTGAIIEHECKLADFVHVAPGAVLAGNVSIGDASFIGANAVIKQGINIGKNVTIGAGTVVISDVPDNCVAVGNPSRILQ